MVFYLVDILKRSKEEQLVFLQPFNVFVELRLIAPNLFLPLVDYVFKRLLSKEFFLLN